MFITLVIIVDEEDHYHMVFEYAKDGTLRQYLMAYFPVLTWERKYELGLDIASALAHLHNLDIIHKDLVMCDFPYACIVYISCSYTLE